MNGAVREPLSKIWWLVLLRGSLAFLLGLSFITAPGATLAAVVLFLGAYWFVQGVFSVVAIFVGASSLPWGWLLLHGVIGMLAGVFVLNHPLLTSILVPTTVVIVLAVQGIIMGLIDLAQGFKGDGARAVSLGIINILLGVILLARPLVAASLLPILLGVLGIVGGIVLIALAFRLRGVVRKALAESRPSGSGG